MNSRGSCLKSLQNHLLKKAVSDVKINNDNPTVASNTKEDRNQEKYFYLSNEFGRIICKIIKRGLIGSQWNGRRSGYRY